jgi:hypothetical protein
MITFRSSAAGDVMMFDDVGRHMIEIMGKEPADRGIVTVEQLPDAVGRLKQAIAADRARQSGEREESRPQTEAAADGSQRAYVSIAQRAVPLLELLEYSLKDEEPVLWGS